MAKITRILPKPEKERVWIYVDNAYCTSVRERTFEGLKLSLGQTISCDEIKELESHHWKHKYGAASWEKEKVRTNKVDELVRALAPEVTVAVTGFGADTNAFIPAHPDEQGKPDLEIRLAHTGATVMWIEVTGTEVMRGDDYWVRPDKLAYAANHPDRDVWVVLHYAKPEQFVFIQPNPATRYVAELKRIGDSDERMVIFNNRHPDVKSQAVFADHLKNRIAAAIAR